MQHVIFDWSGTVADNRRKMYRAVRSIFLQHGKKLPYTTFKREFKQPLDEFYRRYFPRVPYTRISREFRKSYTAQGRTRLFPGMQRQLWLLKKRGAKLYIFTSHPTALLKQEMRDTGIYELFTGIEGGVRDKELSLISFIERLGLPLKTTFYVGDMESDVRAASAAGAISVAVGWGYHSISRLKSQRPDILVRNVSSLSRLLSPSKIKKGKA